MSTKLPRTVVIGGRPGSGKSTLGQTLIASGRVAGIAIELLDGDQASTGSTEYRALPRLDKAKWVLTSALELNTRGIHAVIAMGFGFPEQRDVLFEHESATGIDLLQVFVLLPEALRRERLLARGETPAHIAILESQGYSDWPKEMIDVLLGAKSRDGVRTILGALLP